MSWHPDYPLDMSSPVRHAATVLEGAERPLSAAELADTYRHPNPADIVRVRTAEGLADAFQAKTFLMQKALETLDGGIESVGAGLYKLAVPFEELRADGKPIHRYIQPEHEWARRQPWDTMTDSPYLKDIRWKPGHDDISALKESLQAFGWLDEFPALADERGIILVGHRRIRAAKELGIEPKIKTLTLGIGEAGDAERFKLAIASNIGSKPLSREDMKRLAEYLYGEGWSMARIGEALTVTQQAVSKWSNEFTTELKIRHDKIRGETGQSKRGRPRSSARQTPGLPPETVNKIVEESIEFGGSKTQTEIAKEIGLSIQPVKIVQAQERARREERERLRAQPLPASEPDLPAPSPVINDSLVQTFMEHASTLSITLNCGCVFRLEKQGTTAGFGFVVEDAQVCQYHVEKTDGNNFDGPGQAAPAGEWAHMVRIELEAAQ